MSETVVNIPRSSLSAGSAIYSVLKDLLGNLNSACISPKTGWSIIPCTVEGMFGRKRKSMIFTMVPFA